MFDRKSLGRWLILPIAALCLTQVSARADFTIDLVGGTSGSTSAGLDFFTRTDSQATGTGVIQSFVRISGNTNLINGYNQSARPLQYDENNSPQFTRDLPLSAVPIVTIGGVQYREFLLDINQTSANPLLTLHELQIFTSAAPIVSGAGTVTNEGVNGSGAGTENFTLAGATKIYDLDAQTAMGAQIELDYNLNSGSGSGDMFAYIRSDLFTGAFVTLYSRFGPVQPNNDGFEEWSVRTVSAPPGFVVPEPTTIVTAFTGLPIGLAMLRRRFNRKTV